MESNSNLTKLKEEILTIHNIEAIDEERFSDVALDLLCKYNLKSISNDGEYEIAAWLNF